MEVLDYNHHQVVLALEVVEAVAVVVHLHHLEVEVLVVLEFLFLGLHLRMELQDHHQGSGLLVAAVAALL